MGQANSIEVESQEIRAFTNNYIFVRKFSDIRFGEVKLLQEKSIGTKVLQKDYTSHSVKDYHEYLDKCQKRSAYSHPNIIKIFGYTTQKEDAFCADYFKVSYFFEYFDYDLEQEIRKRIPTKDYLPESEIWYILDSIISACAFLEYNQSPIGDIRPFHILITPNMDYRIIDQCIFDKKTPSNYIGLIQGSDTIDYYLAPEIFKNLNKSKKPAFSHFKTAVFSLGMSLIETANLRSLQQCYNWDQFNFEENKLKIELDKVQMRYSEKLVNIITQMTAISEDRRPDFKILDNLLEENRTEIRARLVKKEQVLEKIELKSPEVRLFSPQKKKDLIKSSVEIRKHEIAVKSSGLKQPLSPIQLNSTNDQVLNDLDKKIKEAVELTENTLAQSTPGNYKILEYDYLINSKQNLQTVFSPQSLQNFQPEQNSKFVHQDDQHEALRSSTMMKVENPTSIQVIQLNENKNSSSYTRSFGYTSTTKSPPNTTSLYSYEPIRYDHVHIPIQEVRYEPIQKSFHEIKYESVKKQSPKNKMKSDITHEIQYDPISIQNPIYHINYNMASNVQYSKPKYKITQWLPNQQGDEKIKNVLHHHDPVNLENWRVKVHEVASEIKNDLNMANIQHNSNISKTITRNESEPTLQKDLIKNNPLFRNPSYSNNPQYINRISHLYTETQPNNNSLSNMNDINANIENISHYPYNSNGSNSTAHFMRMSRQGNFNNEDLEDNTSFRMFGRNTINEHTIEEQKLVYPILGDIYASFDQNNLETNGNYASNFSFKDNISLHRESIHH